MRQKILRKDKSLYHKLICRFCGSDELVQRFSLKIKNNGRQKLYCKKCQKEDYPSVKQEKRKRKPRNWHEYNDQLKRRGDFDLYISREDWNVGLSGMNRQKNGHPFVYPKILVNICMAVRFTQHFPYRQEEGFLEGLVSKFGAFAASPCYTQICRRINAAMKDSKNSLGAKALSKWKKGDILAVDSTGIKVYNRGEWIRHKHKVRRGWLKLHIAVNGKGEAIIAEVTEEDEGDAEVFDRTVSPQLKRLKPSRVPLDMGYDKNSVFDAIGEAGADPVIPPRDGAITRCKSKFRRKVVKEMIGIGYKDWSKKHKHGERWVGEGYFSAFKGTFGEYVVSHKAENMVNELYTKVLILQELREM